MNLAQFEDPFCQECLACPVVTSLSLAQEVAGSNPFTTISNTVTEFSEASENI